MDLAPWVACGRHGEGLGTSARGGDADAGAARPGQQGGVAHLAQRRHDDRARRLRAGLLVAAGGQPHLRRIWLFAEPRAG
eukprot:2325675-Lingulodinium_polyedra.AAC.1